MQPASCNGPSEGVSASSAKLPSLTAQVIEFSTAQELLAVLLPVTMSIAASTAFTVTSAAIRSNAVRLRFCGVTAEAGGGIGGCIVRPIARARADGSALFFRSLGGSRTRGNSRESAERKRRMHT